MVNTNEHGRKEYVQPRINVVIINESDIIATSTGGSGEDGNPDW